ncbi:MAG: archease [Deltaproteobacteria bacterium]|nr:archease [Deltaproteobacteria bacterium]
MPYRYRDDIATADAAFDVEAPTLEDLFRDAADAALGVLVEEPSSVKPRRAKLLRAEAETLDLLLFQVLEELVYYKDAERLLLRLERVEIREGEGGFAAAAEARGEEIDPSRHALLTDVKAVTLHRLRLERSDRGWEATVVLDI